MHISYADIVARRLPLTPAESVALVDAAAAACDREQLATLARLEHILLHANGTVSVADAEADQSVDRLRALAALLSRLLRVDTDEGGRRPAGIPGPLMLMLARVRGEIDLPAPTLDEFRRVLARVGEADPATLAAVYLRTAPAPVVVPDPAVPDAVERTVAPASIPGHSRRRRDAWVAPAAAFAAGCAVALTFVVATGWKPTRSAAALDPSTARAERTATERHDASTAGANDGPVARRTDAAFDRQPARAGATALPTTGVAGEGDEHSPTPLIARTLMTDAFSPSFSTDGGLLFHLGRTDGRLMKASVARDGAVSVTPLVEDAAANFHGVMSPDGTRLAFDSDRDGVRGVYVADADGSAPRRVSGEGFATAPNWSPDGGRLAFVKSEPEHPKVWNVWVVDLATGRLTRVSHHRIGQAWRPSWFPDGRRLAYSVEDDLIVLDLDRQRSRVIRSPERGRLVRTPAVSPDGRRVVFQVFGDGVWLFDLPSGTMHRVLADRTAEEFAWSPDGKRIAFHARHVGRWSLWQLSL